MPAILCEVGAHRAAYGAYDSSSRDRIVEPDEPQPLAGALLIQASFQAGGNGVAHIEFGARRLAVEHRLEPLRLPDATRFRE